MRASTVGSITWVVVPAFPARRTRRPRVDQRSSAGFPSRFFTSSAGSPSRTLSMRAGAVTPRRASRSLRNFASRPCPKKITEGRSASPYTQKERLAKKARRSSIFAIVHACPARPWKDRWFHHDLPPIRYSYSASTFSSAGTTLSIL